MNCCRKRDRKLFDKQSQAAEESGVVCIKGQIKAREFTLKLDIDDITSTASLFNILTEILRLPEEFSLVGLKKLNRKTEEQFSIDKFGSELKIIGGNKEENEVDKIVEQSFSRLT